VPGIHGEQIVRELGLADQWDALIAKGVVVAPA
jgi:hypothetical protein